MIPVGPQPVSRRSTVIEFCGKPGSRKTTLANEVARLQCVRGESPLLIEGQCQRFKLPDGLRLVHFIRPATRSTRNRRQWMQVKDLWWRDRHLRQHATSSAVLILLEERPAHHSELLAAHSGMHLPSLSSRLHGCDTRVVVEPPSSTAVRRIRDRTGRRISPLAGRAFPVVFHASARRQPGYREPELSFQRRDPSREWWSIIAAGGSKGRHRSDRPMHGRTLQAPHIVTRDSTTMPRVTPMSRLLDSRTNLRRLQQGLAGDSTVPQPQRVGTNGQKCYAIGSRGDLINCSLYVPL
jgi:hypothetical protein